MAAAWTELQELQYSEPHTGLERKTWQVVLDGTTFNLRAECTTAFTLIRKVDYVAQTGAATEVVTSTTSDNDIQGSGFQNATTVTVTAWGYVA